MVTTTSNGSSKRKKKKNSREREQYTKLSQYLLSRKLTLKVLLSLAKVGTVEIVNGRGSHSR